MESSPRPSGQSGESQGFLLRALLVSLVAHVLVLGLLAPNLETMSLRPPARILEGRFLAARTESVPVAAEVTVAAPSVVMTTAPGAAPPRRESRAAAASSTSVSPASTIAVSSSQPTVAESGGEAVARVTTESATVALAPRIVEHGADAAGLRQFRLALAGEARRLKRYPEMARREGLAGTAEVRVAVENGGAVRRADLIRSSGHALLDSAALEMLGAAVARTSLPESLRGRSFAVLLPVVFEVED